MMQTHIKVGDKVHLSDVSRNEHIFIEKDINIMTKREEKQYLKELYEHRKISKENDNGYKVIEITDNAIHCRNAVIPRWHNERNMAYGKNDLHLISVIK